MVSNWNPSSGCTAWPTRLASKASSVAPGCIPFFVCVVQSFSAQKNKNTKGISLYGVPVGRRGGRGEERLSRTKKKSCANFFSLSVLALNHEFASPSPWVLPPPREHNLEYVHDQRDKRPSTNIQHSIWFFQLFTEILLLIFLQFLLFLDNRRFLHTIKQTHFVRSWNCGQVRNTGDLTSQIES